MSVQLHVHTLTIEGSNALSVLMNFLQEAWKVVPMAVVGNVWHSALEGIEHASLSKHHCPVLLADKGSQCPYNG